MKVKHILLISFLSFVFIETLFSCAQIVAPTGGKKDTLAPKLVRVFPNNQSKNFRGNLIELQFDEYVNVDNIKQQLVITPSLEEGYETKIMPKGIRLMLNAPLKENTTYNLNFKETFKDITERNPAKNVRLVFSTGNVIDSLKVGGEVVNVLSGKPMLDVTVGLYQYSDTLKPAKNKPYYFTKTDSLGKFNMENVAAGNYRIYAITDLDNNSLYSEAKEMIGFIQDTLNLKSNLTTLKITMSKNDKTKNKVSKSRATLSYYFIDYLKPIKNVKVNFLKTADSITYQQIGNNTLRFFNTKKNSTDTLKVQIVITDSLDRVFTHDQKIKFKVPSKKESDNIKEELGLKIVPDANDDIDPKTLHYKLTFSKPIRTWSFDSIQVITDTLKIIPLSNELITWNKDMTEVNIAFKEALKAKENVSIQFKKGAFISIEADSSNYIKTLNPIRDPELYGTIGGEVKNEKKRNFILQLVNDQGEVVQELFNTPIYNFIFVKAGLYTVRLIVDINNNKRWDTGDVDKNSLPEQLLFIKDKIKLKQNFELTGFNFFID